MKMPGHMGNRRVTVKGLEVIQVDPDRNLLLLKGGVPGGTNGLLEIHRSGKQPVDPVPLNLDQTVQAQAVAENLSEEPLDPEAAVEPRLEQGAEVQEEMVEETIVEEPEVQEPEARDTENEEPE